MQTQILVINAGSSSFKASLYDGSLQLLGHTQTNTFEELAPFFQKIDPQARLSIGHRFVHGGTSYTQSCLVTDELVGDLESVVELAPLHNGPALEVIKACKKRFTGASQVVVFDTAFYSQMPEISSRYAIPQKLADQYGIKRYGFHGISHAYLWQAYQALTGKPQHKIITLHLGAGCSASAIDSGRPIDTSMGFSPAEGLVMATRAGNIDTEVMAYLCEKEKKSPKEVMQLFNFQSGLLGLSGLTSDMRMLLQEYSQNSACKLAVDMFCYRVSLYIGAYMAALNGIDAVIFSAGIGENAPQVRKMILERMQWAKIFLDETANKAATGLPAGTSYKISRENSAIHCYVIATDENRFIAQETRSRLD